MNILAIIQSLHGSAIVYAVVVLFAFIESLVVVGLAFPGTTLMVFVGYLVSRGQLNFALSVLTLSLGGIAGDVLSFYLGRGGKRILKIIEKYLKPDRLKSAEIFFKKYGVAGVVAHRFIGPLRPLLPFAAGLLKMRRRVFIPIDIFSNVASAIFYVAIGVFVSHRWRFYLELFVRYEKISLAAIVIILAGYYVLSKKSNIK
ncbi:MAG: DedA family protein [Patescibacteria group bacterium]|jgi:membrane protein DedA with SNARE-associated domain